MLLKDFLHDRYAPLHQLCDRTVELYLQSIARFEDHLGHPPSFDDLDDLIVSRFLRERCNAKVFGRTTISRHSVKKDRTQLVAMWTLAAKKRLQKADGSVVEFPALPPFRVPEKAPQGYLLDEVKRLISSCQAFRGVTGRRPKPRSWFFATLYLTLWQTAGRIGEVMAATWGDVDWQRGVIRFRAETRKKQTRDIDRPLSPDLLLLLARHQGAPDERIWDWERLPNTIYLHLRRQCNRLGIKCRGFHGFRKAAASYFHAAGGAAHDLLDHHDQGGLARKHYLDPRIVGHGPSALDRLPKIDVTGT
jgi:integrase